MVEFIGRLREVDRDVLEHLFTEHGSALRAFLRGRVRCEEDLQDIMQDVFVRLARMGDLSERLPSGGNSNRAFMMTIAYNLLVDFERGRTIRRRHWESEQSSMEDLERSVQDSPEKRALGREELEWVGNVIMELPDKWRDAFILTRLKHKSHAETATLMGVSLRQVERYMAKALVRINKVMKVLKEAESHD